MRGLEAECVQLTDSMQLHEKTPLHITSCGTLAHMSMREHSSDAVKGRVHNTQHVIP